MYQRLLKTNKGAVLALALFFLFSIVAGIMYFSSRGNYDAAGTASSTLFSNAKDGEIYNLQGYLVKRLSEDEYLFKTDEHAIVVEIDDFVFPIEEFNQHNLLNIAVEIDRDFLEPMEIEVERIDVL